MDETKICEHVTCGMGRVFALRLAELIDEDTHLQLAVRAIAVLRDESYPEAVLWAVGFLTGGLEDIVGPKLDDPWKLEDGLPYVCSNEACPAKGAIVGVKREDAGDCATCGWTMNPWVG